uniref:MACD2 deacetylase n=1 Tax=Otus sunia TaxID=257818 RepID=A0A8C8B6B8_9STRI
CCFFFFKKKVWFINRLLKMTLEERRKEYLRDYVALKNIPTWMEDLKCKSESDGENPKEDLQGKKSLSEKVSLYRGDITLLEVDAIVNAGRWFNLLQYIPVYFTLIVC